MIITESLDNKPAAVTLEPLPDGTTWLYLRKNAKQVEADTGDETPSASWAQTVPVKPPIPSTPSLTIGGRMPPHGQRMNPCPLCRNRSTQSMTHWPL